MGKFLNNFSKALLAILRKSLNLAYQSFSTGCGCLFTFSLNKFSSLSAAIRFWSGSKCAYRWVIARVLWPNRAP